MPSITKIFAIVKDGRRVEDINYLNKESALARLKSIISARNLFFTKTGKKKENSVLEIKELDKPNRIW